MKGLGSWSISSSSSLQSIGVLGGKYTEQIVIVLVKEILTDVACKEVLTFTVRWGTVLFTTTATPPRTLSPPFKFEW